LKLLAVSLPDAGGVITLGEQFYESSNAAKSPVAFWQKSSKNRSGGECRIRNCQFKQDSVRELDGRRIVTLLPRCFFPVIAAVISLLIPVTISSCRPLTSVFYEGLDVSGAHSPAPNSLYFSLLSEILGQRRVRW
jgi:hypothetical protein